jgi:cbb3-type cytochrome oxidase maturation protein
LLKYVSVLLAVFILLAAVPVCAQAPSVQIFDVPSGGYSGTDTLILGDIWNEYVVEVPKGHELVYSFQVIGNGSIRVLLVNEIGTQLIINAQLNYYIEFSTSEPVSSYSATFPPNFSLPHDYTILVANTTEAEVSYSASISINEIDAPDYTIYYILIVLGLVGLVVFSWIIVNRQEDDKKRIAQEARDSRKTKKGKRRR